MWFLNLLRFNETNCTRPQMPKSPFHIFCSITSSNHTKKITSQEKLIFQCNLAMCFLKDSRVALIFEQIEQTKPPVCTCFDSMCVFTCETFLDAKLHCKQNHCPVSSFCRLATIRSSSSEEKTSSNHTNKITSQEEIYFAGKTYISMQSCNVLP